MDNFSLNVNGIEGMRVCACGHEAYRHVLLGPCTVNTGLSEETRCRCHQYAFEMHYLDEGESK